MSEESYQIVSIITVLVSLGSICSSLYIISSWRKLEIKQKNDLIHDYVMYMSICDLLFVLLRGIYLTNPAFKWTFMSNTPITLCEMLGGCLQLFAICSATWNFIISVGVLLPLFYGINIVQTIVKKQNKFIHCVIVALITLTIVLIPSVTNAFGFTDNNASHYGLSKYECWIKKKIYFSNILIPVTFYV
eukprot:396159_1